MTQEPRRFEMNYFWSAERCTPNVSTELGGALLRHGLLNACMLGVQQRWRCHRSGNLQSWLSACSAAMSLQANDAANGQEEKILAQANQRTVVDVKSLWQTGEVKSTTQFFALWPWPTPTSHLLGQSGPKPWPNLQSCRIVSAVARKGNHDKTTLRLLLGRWPWKANT